MQAYLKYGIVFTIILFLSAPYAVKAAYIVPKDSVTIVNDPPQKEKPNKLALWSLILAGGGFLLTFIPYISILSPFMLVGGIVTGIMALGQIKKKKQKGTGLAIASIIIGGVAILAGIAAVLILLSIFN